MGCKVENVPGGQSVSLSQGHVTPGHAGTMEQQILPISPLSPTLLQNRLIDWIRWMALRPHLAGSLRLLDFGKNSGVFSTEIRDLGADYSTVDSSLAVPALPFADNSFDTVLSCHSLRPLITSDKEQHVMSELHRVLIPGGKLVLLEEAGVSGTKIDPNTGRGEPAYRSALMEFFDIRRFRRVRMNDLSVSASLILRTLTRSERLFQSLLPWIGEREIHRAETASPHDLAENPIHEIVIEGAARSKTPFIEALPW